MFDYIDSVAQRMRFIVVGILILASIFFLIALFTASATAQQSDPESAEMTMAMYDGPNAISNAFGLMGHRMGKSLDATGTALASSGAAVGNGFAAVGNSFVTAGTAIGSGVAGTGRFIGNTAKVGAGAVSRGATTGAGLAGRGLFGGLRAAVTASTSVVGLVSNTPVVSATVTSQEIVDKPQIAASRPETVARAQPVDTKEDKTPAQAETAAQTQPAPAPPKIDDSPQWPMNGAITTYFGANDWPYQAVHTGMDISDGYISGVTPIRPFRPGKVVAVYRQYTGLGNYVIVDNGGGVTSVYAHMASILVSPGQDVDKNTVLGMEGSTGASTGPHVHFEIRVNGAVVNPMDYIPGRP